MNQDPRPRPGQTGRVASKETGPEPDNVVIGEVQLLLAEKRTALAVMRTGIAVFVLPLSVFSVLIATSKYYDIAQVVHLFGLVLLICTALVVLGSYLVVRSIRRMRRYDQLILAIKKRHGRLAEFLD